MENIKKVTLIFLSLILCITNVNIIKAEEDVVLEEPKYSVTFTFVSDNEEELPEEIIALTPSKQENMLSGDTIIAPKDYEDIQIEDAVYSFVGWDENEKTIIDTDIKFVGTWTKNVVESQNQSNEVEQTENQEPTNENETYHVTFSFLLWNTFSNEGLPDEVMALLPEEMDVSVGEEPNIPETYDLTAGYQFKGWDVSSWYDDEGNVYTNYFGLWKRLMFGAISGSNPGYADGTKITTGSAIGVPGSGVPSFYINGKRAWCVTPNIRGYARTGTTYYPQSSGYGNASSMSEREANVLITCERRGVDEVTTQLALWDAEGYGGYGVSWRDYYDSSITAWGEVFETYTDPSTGASMQDVGYATGYRVNRIPHGYAKVKKVAASTTYDYLTNSPNNYSLAGAVYGLYKDAACTNLVQELTTDSSGNTSNSESLTPGTYFVKEIIPSLGFEIDSRIYSITVPDSDTPVTVESTEKPMNDPIGLKIYKQDRRGNTRYDINYATYLSEAQFTLKYYDEQSNNPNETNLKYTWVFGSHYNSAGQVICDFDLNDLISGPDPNDLGLVVDGLFTLPLGTFTIEETTSPTLYAADPNIYIGHVKAPIGGNASETIDHYIDKNGDLHELTNDDGGWMEWLNIDNLWLGQDEELQTVTLKIQKLDEDTGLAEIPESTDNVGITNTSTLAGAIFHVYRTAYYTNDATGPVWENLDEANYIDYGTITTDENGLAMLQYERIVDAEGNIVDDTENELLPGKFKIVEEKAPDGYALKQENDSTSYTITDYDSNIESSNGTGNVYNVTAFVPLTSTNDEFNTEKFEFTLTITNKMTRIQVEKLDGKGEQVPLSANAILQLIEETSGNVVYQWKYNGAPQIIKGLTTLLNYNIHELSVDPLYKIAEDKAVNVIDQDDSELHVVTLDHDYSNYYHLIDQKVEIHTTATFDNTGKKSWDEQSNKNYVADGVAHINDEVVYKNLYENDDYVLVGELYDKTADEILQTVEKQFTPAHDSGYITIKFDQNLDGLDNHDFVVFETLYHIVDDERILVIEHKDTNDADQTVHVDELYRGDLELLKVDADDNTKLLDKAVFEITSSRTKRDGSQENYDFGRLASGAIYHEEDNEFTYVIADDEEMQNIIGTYDSEYNKDIDKYIILISELDEGTYFGQVENSTDIKEYIVKQGAIVIPKQKEDSVFTVKEVIEPFGYYKPDESLTFDLGHDVTLETVSFNIENHEIRIHTNANIKETGNKNYVADGVAHINDKVTYEWLYPEVTYKLFGELHDIGTQDNPIDEVVTKAEKIFVPEETHGDTEVEFEFDFSEYEGHKFVVFEELQMVDSINEVAKLDEEGNPLLDENGEEILETVIESHYVCEHKDLNDEDQTVYFAPLFRTDIAIYKTDSSKTVKLNNAIFNLTSSRTKRDGTVVEKTLGKFITGGIYLENDEAFELSLYKDAEMNELVKKYSSAINDKYKKQTIVITGLEDGTYYGKFNDDEGIYEYHIAKGMIYLQNIEEDTIVSLKELSAPEGFVLSTNTYKVDAGHNEELDLVEAFITNEKVVIKEDPRRIIYKMPGTGTGNGVIIATGGLILTLLAMIVVIANKRKFK